MNDVGGAVQCFLMLCSCLCIFFVFSIYFRMRIYDEHSITGTATVRCESVPKDKPKHIKKFSNIHSVPTSSSLLYSLFFYNLVAFLVVGGVVVTKICVCVVLQACRSVRLYALFLCVYTRLRFRSFV